MARVHWKSIAGSRNGLSLDIDVDEMPTPPPVVDGGLLLGLKMMPPAHSDRIQSTERSGPGPRAGSTMDPQYPRPSGTARSSSRGAADWAMTMTSTEGALAGICSALPATSPTYFCRGQHGPHPVVGLDGRPLTSRPTVSARSRVRIGPGPGSCENVARASGTSHSSASFDGPEPGCTLGQPLRRIGSGWRCSRPGAWTEI